MANLNKSVRKAEFTLGRLPREETAAGESVCKTSFTAPDSLMQRLRMLSAKTRKRQGALIIEAIEDVLAKYGE